MSEVIRAKVRPEAEKAAAVIPQLVASVKDGFQINDLFGVLTSVQVITGLNVDFDNQEEMVIFLEELADVLTGTDDTALVNGFLKGLSPEEEEQFLDGIKKLVGKRFRA